MASGGAFSGTLSKGSEEIFEFCCTPCSKDGTISEAVNQCCDENFCAKCLGFHKKFSGSSAHKVLGLKEMRQVKGSKPKKPQPPSQLCQEHGGDRFAIYCADHDVVCCNTGVSVSHKTCDGTAYIVTAAAGIKSSKQLQTTKTSISFTLKEAKRGKRSCQQYLADLDKYKATHIKHVEDYTERLIKRIRELERATIEEITSKHKELSAGVGREVTSLNDVISTMEGDLKKLDISHSNHEAQVFVDVKLSQNHEAESRKLLQQLSEPRKPSPTFQLKTNIEDLLKGVSSLGSFTNGIHVYKAKLKGEYNVKVKQDDKTCDSYGCCQLTDGTLVIGDWTNKRLKHLNAAYNVIDHCEMPRGPWGVTSTAPDEVAVTMPNLKKVQFVTVRDSMSLSRSFPTSDRCRGIHYSGGRLYVACGGLTKKGLEEGPGHVTIYTLQGEQLNKVQADPTCQNIFSCPCNITASCGGDRIYVAQNTEGSINVSVVELDSNGMVNGTISDPSLKLAYGLCSLDNGHILVCGLTSNNVLQFGGDGRKVTELLNNTDGMKNPRSLCYDSGTSRLIVTMNNADNIKVFELI